MKRLYKYLIVIIASLVTVIILFLYFAPVSFDAFTCSGGYSKLVVDKYSEKLIEIFIKEQGLDPNTNFNMVSKPEDIVNTIKWNGRNIYATLKIDLEGKVYTVDYIGRRYWIEKYDWKIQDIYY